jgi:ubiquinol-cytochrome c reductase iron-sulfur subunit
MDETPGVDGRPGPAIVVPVIAFSLSIAAALALTVVYWQGGQPQLEGIFLFIALGGVGVGMVSWAQRFLPEGPDEEERGLTASSEEELERLDRDVERSEEELGRRKVLVRLFVGAMGALGIAALLPIRSLGPRPGAGLKTTPFRRGVRLVTSNGAPIRPTDISVDGVITAFPDGHLADANGPTLLIRLRGEQQQASTEWLQDDPPDQDRSDWTVDEIAAYSKICTHAGCPVGLYQAELGQLLCPCHQSTFDVTKACTPVFGPATRPLPQLPLAVDDAGYLIANGEYSGPVGPGFWDQDRP